MEWMTLIADVVTPLLVALVPTGGIVAVVTIKDKKTEMFLANSREVNAHWQGIADERTQRAQELKSDLDHKESVIQKQWEEISELRDKLDHTRTALAVAELLKCEEIGCEVREPPFGSGQAVQCNICDGKEGRK